MKNLIKRFKIAFGILSVFALLVSCDADVEIDRSFDEILSAQPTITNFTPTSATVMEEVIIEGTFLNFVNKAFIGDVEAKITQRVNSTQIRIQVPPQASGGQIRLVTQAEMEVSSDESISVQYLVPEVISEIPVESTVNENVVLVGENMNTITKVTFGGVEGIIEYKDAQSIVIKTPNVPDSPMNLTIWYYSPQGEVSNNIQDAFSIFIPKPTVSVWPRLMSRDMGVTVTGENMNLVEQVQVDGLAAEVVNLSANSLTFNIPDEIVTGYSDVTFVYAGAETITEESIPYIDGQLETYYDWDTYTEDAVSLDLGKDPLATHKVNGDVPQPPLPVGTGYYHLDMYTPTGSTISRLRFDKTTDNPSWQNILDEGNFSNNPVLHFWVNTEGTTPILKIYIGGTSNPNRRELRSGHMEGEEWKLLAVRLKGFIPDINSTGSSMELRFNTGSSATDLPIKLNLDWVIVTDRVLTEFGAIDVTEEFKDAG